MTAGGACGRDGMGKGVGCGAVLVAANLARHEATCLHPRTWARFAEIGKLEDANARVVRTAFGVPVELPDVVVSADALALEEESRAYFSNHAEWGLPPAGHEPEALPHYEREGTPLRRSADGATYRVDITRAAWFPEE